MKEKKTFISKVLTRYLIIIRSEENFAEKTSFTTNLAKIIAIIAGFLILFSLAGYQFSVHVIKPLFVKPENGLSQKKQILALNQTIDSLIDNSRKTDIYIQNFMNLVNGKYTSLDSVQKGVGKDVDPRDINLDYLPPADSQLRKEFEEEKDMEYSRAKVFETSQSMMTTFLFSPVQGIITDGFDAEVGHFGVDIVTKPDEPILSVADGTVIIADYTVETGHVIAIQHNNDLISVYKHNSVLLKKVGNFVESGDAIAIVGNTGENSTGPHLHLELWRKGLPLNPESFIEIE